MGSYIFDIILITLAIVILLHLLFNNSLYIRSVCQNIDTNQNTGPLTGSSRYNIQSETHAIKDPASRSQFYASDTKSALPKLDDTRARANAFRISQNPDNGYQYPENSNKYCDNVINSLDYSSKDKQWYEVADKLVKENADNGGIPKALDIMLGSKRGIKNSDDKYVKNNVLDNLKNSNTTGKTVFLNNYDGKIVPSTFDPVCKKSNEKYTDVLGNVCSVNNDSLNMKRYIRDYVLDGKAQCGCVSDKSKSAFTRNEIDAYREQHLEFGNKINGSSAPAEDPVDRMNLIYSHGGVNADGQTIADVYDKLLVPGSTPTIMLPYPLTNCVSQPSFDNGSGVPHAFYTSDANNGGKYMLRDNWMYSGENPNNGGVLYDGIFANDQMMDGNRMI